MSAFEQHFITDLGPHRDLLSGMNLKQKNVLEIGAGHGELTQIIAEYAAQVVAYEIDPDLTPLPQVANLIRIADAATQDLSFLSPDWVLISNPPYAMLPWCVDIIRTHDLSGAVLMTSDRKMPLLQAAGFTLMFTLPGTAFTPVSRGDHSVMMWSKTA